MVKGVLLSEHPAAGIVAAELSSSLGDPTSRAVAMAFYGDLFLATGVQGEDKATDPETLAMAESLALVLLHTAAERGDSRLRSEARGLLSQIDPAQDGVQAAGGVVRGAMARLDGNRWLTAQIFGLAHRAKPDLTQVARYLTEDALRDQIQMRATNLFSDDTRLVIAHSLGSIVGWEALQRDPRSLPMLITIGSPLGLDTIVYPRLRPPPPMFPALVRQWINVAHSDDIIAVEPRLASLFPSTDSRHVEDLAPSSPRAHHNATTYLEQPEVGHAVAEALSSSLGHLDEQDEPGESDSGPRINSDLPGRNPV